MKYFEKCVCISLDRHWRRWHSFQKHIASIHWPFAEVERVNAIDGMKATPPSFWGGTPGMWGCYRSHVRVIEDALNQGVESLLVMEEDVLFSQDFGPRAGNFLDAVPSGWAQIYFGGVSKGAETQVNAEVIRSEGIVLTHCYALSGHGIEALYKHLSETWDRGPWDVDQRMRMIHRDSDFPVYRPLKWLASQNRSASSTREEEGGFLNAFQLPVR